MIIPDKYRYNQLITAVFIGDIGDITLMDRFMSCWTKRIFMQGFQHTQKS